MRMRTPALTAAAAFDALQEGIVLEADDGRIIYANRAAKELLGGTPGVVSRGNGRAVRWDTVTETGAPLPPEERPAARAMRTGRPHGPTVVGMRRPDGERLWLRVACRPFGHPSNPDRPAILCSFVDVTAEHEARVAAHRVRPDRRRPSRLSPREREVLQLLADGLTGEQVAERLALSSATVRVHIRNATTKLGAATRAQAVAVALARGEIEMNLLPVG